MNIFKFELKKSMESFLIWVISLITVYLIFMVGIYPLFTDSMQQIQEVFLKYPPEFIEAFGFDISAMFSYGGYYGFTFVYLVLVGVIMAVSLSVATFSREKRSKCMDFILTKPVKREVIFGYKLAADMLIIILTNIGLISVGMSIFRRKNIEDISAGTFFFALLAVFLTQIVFLCIGVFIAVYLKKIRSVSGIATSIGFGAFILSAVVNILKEDALKIMDPLRYFEPGQLFEHGSFEIRYIVAALIISVACLVSSYVRFCKSDTPAV